MAQHIYTGTAAPATTPAAVGHHFIDTTGGNAYISTGTSSSADWKLVNGSGFGLVANPLSQFAATTSAQLAGVLTDETGTGAAVFANSPALTTPNIGTPSAGTLTNCTGLPAAGLIAPGSTGQVVYNNAGAPGAAANATIDGAGNVVIGEYTTTTPSAPSSGATFYTRKKGGKRLMEYIDAVSSPRPLMHHFGMSNIKFARPRGNSTTFDTNGFAPLANGTATAAAFTTTDFRQTCSRIMYASAAGAGSSAGFLQSSQQFHRGGTSGWGGFFMVSRFAFPVQQTTWRFAIGMFNTNAALTNINPSANTHMCCVGLDSSDTDVRFMTNGAGTATTSATGYGATIAASDVFEYRVFCPAAGTTIYMGFGCITPGATTWSEYSTASTLPAATNMLAPQLWMNNGTTAAAVNIEIMTLVVESDF
jgi:hypothetical protein